MVDDELLLLRSLQRILVREAFEAASVAERYDVVAYCRGGGSSGQAGALRHGIARALENIDPELRGPLKRKGFLTRDPRKKERKKLIREIQSSFSVQVYVCMHCWYQ